PHRNPMGQDCCTVTVIPDCREFDRKRAMITRICTATEMTDGEKQEFIALVAKGGQVNEHTLPGLVDSAVALVTLHDGQSLVGCSAVKVPSAGHHHDDFEKAGVLDRAA